MDSSLTARRIGRCKRLVLGTPAYFERAGTPSTPSELSTHRAVVYLQGEGSVWSFRRESTELSVSVQSRLRVTAAEGVRAAVLADAGLTIASEWMFSPELRSGAVRSVLMEWSLAAARPVGGASNRPGRHCQSESVREFLRADVQRVGERHRPSGHQRIACRS